MNLLRARVPQKAHNARAGRAAHDGVVDHHNPLSAHNLRNRVQLDAHPILAAFLSGGDECPPDIFVFDESEFIRDSRLLGISDCRVDSAVRNSDHHIRLHGVLQCEERSRAHPRRVNAATVDHRIGTGKVNVFKNAMSLPGLT